LEVYAGGEVATLDDFRSLEITQKGKRLRLKSGNQNKGQATEIAETIKCFRTTGVAPIPFNELVIGMKVIFAVQESLASTQPVDLS